VVTVCPIRTVTIPPDLPKDSPTPGGMLKRSLGMVWPNLDTDAATASDTHASAVCSLQDGQ